MLHDLILSCGLIRLARIHVHQQPFWGRVGSHESAALWSLISVNRFIMSNLKPFALTVIEILRVYTHTQFRFQWSLVNWLRWGIFVQLKVRLKKNIILTACTSWYVQRNKETLLPLDCKIEFNCWLVYFALVLNWTGSSISRLVIPTLCTIEAWATVV